MAALGRQLWRAEDSKTAAIRLITLKYTAPCDSMAKCPRRATTGIECRDKIGRPIWRKDWCDEHARPMTKARALGIKVYWHGDLREGE